MRKAVFALCLFVLALQSAHAHDPASAKVPPYYVIRKHCLPDRGFVAVAEAPGYQANYPMLALLVFNGEIVGSLLEVHEKDGWKPWYDQPQGQPVSHDGGPKHYTQTAMIKKGPTADECRAAMTR